MSLQVHFSSGTLEVSLARCLDAASTPFALVLHALSPDASLDLSAIVGQPATFVATAGQVHVQGLGARTFSGVIRRAEQVEAVGHASGAAGASTYRFELVPRLWLLTQRRDYHVYQHLSIPDIAEQLLARWQVPHAFQIDRARYPRLEYKIQYGESDHDFLSRLLEEAGIAHVFENDEGGNSLLVLADHLHARAPRPGGALGFVDHPNQAAEMEFVTAVRWGREIRPGARVLRDHDFRGPARAHLEPAPKTAGVEGRLEQYDYDAGAFLIETGKGGDTPVADDQAVARYDADHGRLRATGDLEAMRTGARTIVLETNAYDLRPGAVFCIEGHPHAALPPSRRLLVTRTVLEAEAQGEWKMRVEAVPADVPYRPSQTTKKAIAHGFQSAKVVGPAGQEIHTDEFGRVRVQFPWDRHGKHDAHSSCWVRVHEGWGGLGYGVTVLPRIGQEVLVTFLQGDPDQPIVVGRAYNAVEQVPYKLPLHKTRSTWKSDSSLGSGGFNEIMLEDLKGRELVWQQAQKDRVRLVKHDETATVGHDRSILVKGDLEDRTGHNRQRWVGKDEDSVVKQTRRERIERDSHLEVSGSSSERVLGSQSLTVLEDQDEQVGGRYALSAGRRMHVVAGTDLVGEGRDVTVRGPGGFLRIDQTGVTISGVLVKINVGGSPGAGHGAKPEDPHDAPPHEAEPVQSKASPLQKKAPPAASSDCAIATVELACQHEGDRKFKLTLPAKKGAKAPSNMLEVIAADPASPEKIKTTIVLSKPRCATHTGHALTVTGPSGAVTKAEDVSTVDVSFGEHDVDARLLAWIWPWGEAPVAYTFVATACHSPAGAAIVRVYPKVEPSITLELALDTDDRVKAKIAKAQGAGRVEKRGRPAETAWKFELKAKVKYGDHLYEIGAKYGDKIKQLAAVNRLVKRGIDLFCEYFYTFTGVTLLPVFPKLGLKYDGKFKEIEGTHRIGAEWSITFKANPLLGITAKFEILDLMIEALGKTQFAVIARVLGKIRKWAKEKGQKFEISLAFSGLIGGELGAKKNAAILKASVFGVIEGKVKAEFSATASFGSKGIVDFSLGAEVKAETGLFAKLTLDNDDKGVFLRGSLGIAACKLRYAAWASGKMIWEIKESYGDEFTFWPDTDLLKSPDVYLLKRP